jgi:hypothetical protein
MAHIVSFKTNRFDVTRETPNEFNAFAGESVLSWLREELIKHGYESTAPDMEDWGWYLDVKKAGSSYLVGATAELEYGEDGASSRAYAVSPGAMLEWTIQVHKQRGFMDKLLGKNRMNADDELSALVEGLVRNDNRLREVSVVRESETQWSR